MMTEPKILGNRYELDEVVGRGGMAEVWRGRDIRLGRTVALKMLRVDHAADATFQARFRREAQSAASLNHHNIVAVYDTGEDLLDGHRVPYIVMEYVEGQTLREMVRDRARFTPERTIEVMAATLDALEYSHRAGIVHRDIKPGNVMITAAGEVKVMDFGIARSLADTGMALTQTAAVVGTAQYISPEQARGEQADARSDLYATGCVLYELLTGRPPFVGDSLVSVAVSHVREMAPPPSALEPTVPRELDSIVMKALAKDRRERYQSAYEMRADLQRAAAGLPVAAAADVTASTQLMGGAAPTTAYAQEQYDDEPYDDYEDEDEGGVPIWAVILGALVTLGIAGLIGFLLFRGDEVTRVIVPDVIGMSEAEATETLTDEGLTVEVLPQPVDDEADIGIVSAQNPPDGERLEEGDTVTITVGVEPEDVEVPNVEGMSRAEAENELRSFGLVPADDVSSEETEDENLDGTVAATDPAIGSPVQPGSTVTLTIYALPDSVVLRDLRGETADEARDYLEGLGLDLDISEEERASSEDEGIVVETDPAGGNTVENGNAVTLYVSTGEEEPISLPDVRGMDVNQASQELREAGFEVNPVAAEYCEATSGTVFEQDPAGDSEQPPDTVVTITYAIEPDGGCEGDIIGGDEGGNEGGTGP